MASYFVAVATISLIYMLLAMGLNLQYGHTGLINFGHVAFFAAGAYASALLSLAGWPLPASFLAAMIVAALLAWPIGLLALRLADDYLAIVTLGFSETLRIVLQEEGWLTGGVQGLPGIPGLFAGLGPDARGLATLGALALCNAVAFLLLRHLVRSPYGRLIRAIRDDQTAVQALGKSAARPKTRMFMLGAMLAGLAGAFYAHFIAFLSPEQFVPLVTFYVWIAVIIGGAGSMAGAAAGSVLLLAFLEGSRFLRDALPGVSEIQMASVRLAVVGLALILCMLYRPQGLFGRRKG